MPIRDFHYEADLRPSYLDRGQHTCSASEYSIIEHPFRVLVHDEECYLMVVGTTPLGPANDVDLFSMQFIERHREWANALIINRVDLSLRRIVAKGVE